MIYIRKIFPQDLAKGKQIAFPKEPSLKFFNFDYLNNEPDRRIFFKFDSIGKEFPEFNGENIKTRLYAAGSESRIDGELKAFLRDSLRIEIDDFLIIKNNQNNNAEYDFFVVTKNNRTIYDYYLSLTNAKNHTLVIVSEEKTDDDIDDRNYNRIVFGAPGTGKSFTLNKNAKKFEKQEKFNLADAIKLAFEKIDPQENFVPQCFAIGMKYAKEILEKYPRNTQKEVNAVIGKEREDDIAGYYILTGAQAATFFPNAKLSCSNNNFVERVTFHPNYSYSQFVGCYKPIAKIIDVANNLPADKKQILDILVDKSRSGQEKYDLLYDQFKGEDGLTRLPLLIGIYSDDEFHTKKLDGTAAAKDNSVERNHGRAIRPYVSLFDRTSKKENISYEYVPGPFMRTYVAAKKNPRQKFLLIIEEINRANVAAVFGDVFQLLDRKDGVSEYPIATSEDIRKYLKANDIDDCEELRIPNNMYIWATMNSADQGVLPMDTAFKRRWEFEYIGINHNESEIDSFYFPTSLEKDDNGNESYVFENWNSLRTKLNEKLQFIGVNEDKLLGPFFINKDSLEEISSLVESKITPKNYDPIGFPITADDTGYQNKKKIEAFRKSFESKVLMYLYEDMRMYRPNIFQIKDKEKNIENPRLSQIFDAFENDGVKIFNFSTDRS